MLNPDGSRQQTLGYRPHRFDTTGPDGQPAGGIVWLHPDHGGWLAELESAGARPERTTIHCPTPMSESAVDQVAIEGEPEGECQTEEDADPRDGC